MAETTAEIGGRCLCGAVRFTTPAPQKITLCHCGMCRRWGGGLPLAGFVAKVSLSEGDALRWWKSSEWGERGFCGECGASLFWRAPEMDGWEVSAGAMDS
ncbi:MAG: GFA family protein, partial [Gammaproteobacteria bacterium]